MVLKIDGEWEFGPASPSDTGRHGAIFNLKILFPLLLSYWKWRENSAKKSLEQTKWSLRPYIEEEYLKYRAKESFFMVFDHGDFSPH